MLFHEIINELHKLGVSTINFTSDDTKILEIILKAFIFAKTKMISLPDFLEAGGRSSDVASWNNSRGGKGTIIINTKASEWNLTKNSHHFTSTTHQYHNIIHELGHLDHYRNGSSTISKNKSLKFSPEEKKLIEKEVSTYAGYEPNEFVAEVFAAIKLGKTYSSTIMELYKFYKSGIKTTSQNKTQPNQQKGPRPRHWDPVKKKWIFD